MHSSPADFSQLLRGQVRDYFRDQGRSSKGSLSLHLKPLIFIGSFTLCYFGFIFFSPNIWVHLLWCFGMIFAMGGIGFGFAHDACHGAFSESPLLNKVTGLGYDLMGASSYVWKWKHNVLHHSNPNHFEHDPDVQTKPFLRLSKSQPWVPMNRYQHLYFPFLYFFILVRWQLWQDFATYAKGDLLGKPFRRPSGIDLLIFWSGKLLSIFFALVFPAFFLPFSTVLLGYFVVMGGLGILLGTLIQLAHCTEGASFESSTKGAVPASFEEQIRRSSNFCPKNRFLTWYTGGLNYQIEHHLFPGIASVHYPAISGLVKEACREHKIPYISHESFIGSLKAHVRHLRQMGLAERH